MLHIVSSCWYAQIFLLFCFCLPLTPTVLPISEIRLLSQRGMAYCCVSHSQLFLTGFILLTKPPSCVPGSINCNMEDLTTISSLTQDDYHQRIDVILFIWECDKVDMRGGRGNKERWYCGLCGNEHNIWNYKKF